MATHFQKINKIRILTLLLVAFATITNAQNSLIVRVISEEHKENLIGATLLLKGTNNGTSTNKQGGALLKNIPNGKHTIIISYIGYQQKQISYNFPQETVLVHEIKLSTSYT